MEEKSPWRTVWNIPCLGNEETERRRRTRARNVPWRDERKEVNTRSKSFKGDGLMSSQIQWLISRQWWRVEWRSAGRQCVHWVSDSSQIVIPNSREISASFCVYDLGFWMLCGFSITEQWSKLIWNILSAIIQTFWPWLRGNICCSKCVRTCVLFDECSSAQWCTYYFSLY